MQGSGFHWKCSELFLLFDMYKIDNNATHQFNTLEFIKQLYIIKHYLNLISTIVTTTKRT